MSLKQLAFFTRFSVSLFLCCLALNALAGPNDASPKSTSIKARLDLESKSSLYKAFSLPSGSTVRISSAPQFSVITALVTNAVKQTYDDLEGIFGPSPTLSIDVKLLPEDVFFLATQAPNWTNALYYDGTIIVPVRQQQMNTEDLKRSIRHEFTHAMISAFTNGNAPGWFDEGFAQLMEGPAHPALGLALKKWMAHNPALPFHILQNGFTKLETKYVVPAYAQSFWAVRYLGGQYGFLKMRLYFERLKQDHPEAFRASFGVTESEFESELQCVLKDPVCLNNPESCGQCKKIQAIQVSRSQ